MIHLVIQGNPLPKSRPRFARVGGFVKTYDNQVAKKTAISYEISRQLFKLIESPLQGAIKVHLIFHMPIAESSSHGALCEKLWGVELMTHKPDIDNLEKTIFDCMSGRVYKDDAQVVALSSEKRYSANPRTEIFITEVKKMDLTQKAQKIITRFTPAELKELLYDAKDMGELFDECDDVDDEIHRKIRLETTATVLEKFCVKHSKMIYKIASSCKQ